MSSEIQGLFWEPKKKVKRKRRGAANVMPRIKSKWKPTKPSNWPNYKHAKVISIDTETYDPNLLTHGPGYARHDGNLVGISAAVGRNECIYLPMRHEIESNLNHDPEKVLLWAKDNLTTPNQLKIGANIQYDIGWLREEGVIVPGPYLDVQHAEKLIFEHHRTYSLDSLSKRYLNEGKVSNKLYNWLSDYYGGKADQYQRKNIYRAPVSYVGPYAEGDAWQPLEIWEKQEKIIKAQNLTETLDLECRLIPLLLDMRFRGVRVDLDEAEQIREDMLKMEVTLQQQLNEKAGVNVNAYASASIAKVFDKHNMKYPLTEKGNPSFVKQWMERHPSEIAKLVVEVKKVNKLRVSFIENAILGKNVNERIHCEFNQLGTITGRFSSSSPNLQQISSRDKIYAPLIRGCFKPDEGYKNWLRTDASQAEYRGFAHLAVGKDATNIRRKYQTDKHTDYHQALIEMVHQQTGITIERKSVKNLNFALIFGAGKKKVCSMLGLDKETGNMLYEAYMNGAPFVADSLQYYSAIAQRDGFVVGINKRRMRFPFWEEPYSKDNTIYKSYAEALRAGIREPVRAYTYKALNSAVQNFASVFMKASMVEAYEQGIFERLGGAPHLTIHDEICLSCNFKQDKKIIKELVYAVENSVKLSVPMLMDTSVGKDWGHCKGIKL